jgi:hypothetical protein
MKLSLSSVCPSLGLPSSTVSIGLCLTFPHASYLPLNGILPLSLRLMVRLLGASYVPSTLDVLCPAFVSLFRAVLPPSLSAFLTHPKMTTVYVVHV